MEGNAAGDLMGAGLLGYGMSQYQNPASAGMPYLNQISGMLPQYFSPWMNAGQQALPQLQQQYGQLLGEGQGIMQQNNQLMNNPGGEMNRIGSGFQQSPGYQFQVGQSENAVNHAASAGGMLGTPAEQQNMAQTVGGLANQDYYNYLNHGMSLYSQGLNNATNMYGEGLQGMGNMAQMGLGASSNLGENLTSALMSQANLAYAGQANQNQSQQGALGGIGSLLGSGLSAMGAAGML